jgi:hypothetical protein
MAVRARLVLTKISLRPRPGLSDTKKQKMSLRGLKAKENLKETGGLLVANIFYKEVSAPTNENLKRAT